MPRAPADPGQHLNGDSNGSHVEVRLDHADYSAVVALLGEHDIATKIAMHDALAPLYGRVLVDLSACTFSDSTVIGVLLDKRTRLVRDGQSLELLIPTAPVTHALSLMRIAQVVPVHSEPAFPIDGTPRCPA